MASCRAAAEALGTAVLLVHSQREAAQCGRAPYGHVVVDGGQHPSQRKAAEGYRLRVQTSDEP